MTGNVQGAISISVGDRVTLMGGLVFGRIIDEIIRTVGVVLDIFNTGFPD